MSLMSLNGMVTRWGGGVIAEPEARVSGFRRVSAPLCSSVLSVVREV